MDVEEEVEDTIETFHLLEVEEDTTAISHLREAAAAEEGAGVEVAAVEEVKDEARQLVRVAARSHC